MYKKTVLSVLLIVMVSALLLVAVAGCSRPKPEPKLTPTVEVVEPTASETPASAPTQVVTSPTVITTIPTQSAPQPTTASAQPEAGATPTLVVISATPQAEATTEPESTEPSGEWFMYTIQWGDTLYSLAARYGTSVEALSALNNLSRPDDIQSGMQIKIPKSGGVVTEPGTKEASEYVVQAGDDLNGIAIRFGVTVDAIVSANGLTNADFIYVGQKLVIPGQGESPAVPATSGGKIHIVKPGESIDMIASAYGTTRQAIVTANNLANPNWIYVGQKLTIP